MKSCSNIEVRRCRPLLGTFVEIQAGGWNAGSLARAVDAAFASIERVQRRLSVHDPESEISRVNAEAFLHPVPVGGETFEVLGRGMEIARQSAGAFDMTVAPLLARWGLLPANLLRRGRGDWRDLRLLPRQCVRFHKPLALDLGGIAKGFAVDAAIDTLRGLEVSSATVNAGGDLRVFGPNASAIHLRHPLRGYPLANPVQLRNAALATSSPCFSLRGRSPDAVSHLVNPHKRRPVTGGISVTIRARECWLADALTKVVLNSPRRAEQVLKHHGADAIILET